MANTDFFDDDLVKGGTNPKEIKIGPGERATGTMTPAAKPENIPGRSVSDLNLTRMAQHKKEVNDDVAQAVHELERLKKRQEDLEFQKKELEDLRTKQADYEGGKREIIEHLRQSLVTLEKDEIQADNFTQLLATTRKRFRAMLTEIEDINEDAWPEGGLREELNDALALIDNARIEYNKSTAKIDAMKGESDKPSTSHDPLVFEDRRFSREFEKPFSFWLKVGFAATIPLIITVVVVTALYLYLVSNGLL